MTTSNDPLVSVVLPTYNRAHTLPRAMRSVLLQGYPNLELLVVDDGSTDGTDAVMATLTDPRVRYLKMERNGGASAARNLGMAEAKGEYIAFQDSDDEWLADKLRRQVDAAQATGVADVVVAHPRILYGRDEARVYGPGRVCCVPMISEPEEQRDYAKIMHRRNLLSPQTVLFSRSLLAKVGKWDTALVNSVDWDFAIRLSRHGKMVFIEEPLCVAYIQGDSISRLKRSRLRSQLRIIQKLYRAGDVDPDVLSEHYGRLGLALARMGSPRLGRRLLLRAASLTPKRVKPWARLAALPVTRGARP